jgi:molybdopterin converting factor small subunit
MIHEKRKEQEKSVSIRFPIELREQIKETAQENERSTHGEVLIAVREHMTRQKKGKKLHAHEEL